MIAISSRSTPATDSEKRRRKARLGVDRDAVRLSVTIAFLWQLFGSLLGAPKWLVDLTPFAHAGLVPSQAFRVGAAVAMVAIGAVVVYAAIRLFERRDLLGA